MWIMLTVAVNPSSISTQALEFVAPPAHCAPRTARQNVASPQLGVRRQNRDAMMLGARHRYICSSLLAGNQS